MTDDEWVVVKPAFKRKPKVDDGEWQIVGSDDPQLKNPPPRSIKLHIKYEALLEGRIEWGSEW